MAHWAPLTDVVHTDAGSDFEQLRLTDVEDVALDGEFGISLVGARDTVFRVSCRVMIVSSSTSSMSRKTRRFSSTLRTKAMYLVRSSDRRVGGGGVL